MVSKIKPFLHKLFAAGLMWAAMSPTPLVSMGVLLLACGPGFVLPVPTVTAISPATGLNDDGTLSVVITGTYFLGGTNVAFGTQGASFTITDINHITATAPITSQLGLVDVVVTTLSGSSATSSADQFVYTTNHPIVASISPGKGATAGGTSITITGTSFKNYGNATAVKFGSTNAASFAVVDDTTITAVTPAGSGVEAVTVTNPIAVSANIPAGNFNFTASSYVGPGDAATGALNFYGLRAYNVAALGSAAINVCFSGTCVDFPTDATTGALVPQTISAHTCTTAGECTVKIWYDQSGAASCSSAACNLTQAVTADQPQFIPAGSGNGCTKTSVPCVMFPHDLASMAGGAAFKTAAPFTVSNVIVGPPANYGATNSVNVFSCNGFVHYFSASGNSVLNSYVTGAGSGVALSAGPAVHIAETVIQAAAGSVSGTVGSGTYNRGTFYPWGAQGFPSGAAPTGTCAGTVGANAGLNMGNIGAVSTQTFGNSEAGIWGAGLSSAAQAALYANQYAYFVTPPTGSNHYFASVGTGTAPCATSAPTTAACPISQFTSLTLNPADNVFFNGGDTFVSCLYVTPYPSGVTAPAMSLDTSVAYPITFGAYGTGTPTIQSNCPVSGNPNSKSTAVVLDSAYIVWNGINVIGSGLTASTATYIGIGAANSGASGAPQIIVENVDVTGFASVTSPPSPNSNNGAEIFMSGFSDLRGLNFNCGFLYGQVLNSTAHGASVSALDDSGIVVAGCSGNAQYVVNGNVIFDLGSHYSGGGNAGGSGILMGSGGTNFAQATSSGTSQYDLVHDMAWNVTQDNCGGPVGWWFYAANKPQQQFGEVYNVIGSSRASTVCDLAGLDDDASVDGALSQYIYTHNNGGPSLQNYDAEAGTSGDPWSNNTWRYIVSENDNAFGYNCECALELDWAQGGYTGGVFYVYNNTIFNNQSSTGRTTPPACIDFGFAGTAPPTGMFVANNACYITRGDQFGRTVFAAAGSGVAVDPTVNLQNNDYGPSLVTGWVLGGINYTSLAAVQAAGYETSSQILNPTFTGAPFGTLTWTPKTQSSWPPSGNPSPYGTTNIASGLKCSGVALGWSAWAGGTPTRDYFANSVPSAGPCWAQGAYGGT